MRLAAALPILEWGRHYDRKMLASDVVAALVVTIMLVPQSLAYALLAGLPAEVGLYASIAPLLLYALFGTSRTLAVGPVAVIALMTATAAGSVAAEGSAEYLEAALALALLSGLILLAMGVLRLGFLANLLSHPVISGFITASGILIATSQLRHLFGVAGGGDTLPEMLTALLPALSQTHVPTLVVGLASLLFLVWARQGLKPLLERLGLAPRAAELAARGGPALAVIGAIAAVAGLGLDAKGVAVVGTIPAGLPPLGLPEPDPDLWGRLAVPAFLIALVGFVESVSVAQTLAARRRQRIVPDQELIGLGAANVAAAATGGMPVTGGFARSVVNFDAGAETPAAGAFTAVGIFLAALFLAPLLALLPVATLSATIIVAVLAIIDVNAPLRIFRYSRRDFAAMAITILVTLLAGVEPGIVAGVAASLLLHLWRSATPHAAIVGRVPGTEHFRNVQRHEVITFPHLLTVRVDESLTYLNARWLEEFLLAEVAARPALCHVVLMCSAVNAIDASALESLEAINHRLADAGIRLHLSEVKGPVMDRLQKSHFLDDLSGRVFLSQHDAFLTLAADPDGMAPPLPDPWGPRGLI
ncbi:SulP family inorganic anion transporter [Thermaurantiacus sp.]